MVTMPVEVYTDGSCIRNPGPGGWAYIIRYWESTSDTDMPEAKEFQANQGYRLTTNNRMEIMGAVMALREVIQMKTTDPNWAQVGQANLMSDSEYFCKAINQNWIQKWKENNWMTSGFKGTPPKPVKNKDLWEQVIEVQEELRNIGINLTVTWVKGHDGNEYNEKCDKLAVAASTGTDHIIDQWYESTTAGYSKK